MQAQQICNDIAALKIEDIVAQRALSVLPSCTSEISAITVPP